MADIILPQSINEFIKKTPNFAKALEAWVTIVKSCNWKTPLDIVKTFGEKAIDILGKKDAKTDTVACERAVIDIKGNHLRVIIKYQFHPKLKKSRVYIKWIGTHAEYSELCDDKKQYDIEMFK